MEQNITNEVSQTLGSEIVETKRQLTFRLPEVIIAVIGLIVGVVLTCFNLSNFWGLALIIFGVMWNFFTEANKLFACMVSFVVCTIFALISISLKIYGMAFLHICFYLPTQLIYFFESKKVENLSMQKNKKLTNVGLLGSILSVLLFAVCMGLVLYCLGEKYFILDAICVALLSLAVFLSNGQYKEYWFARMLACVVSFVAYLYFSIESDFYMNSLTISLLFLMYVACDVIKYLRWKKLHKQNSEELILSKS